MIIYLFSQLHLRLSHFYAFVILLSLLILCIHKVISHLFCNYIVLLEEAKETSSLVEAHRGDKDLACRRFNFLIFYQLKVQQYVKRKRRVRVNRGVYQSSAMSTEFFTSYLWFPFLPPSSYSQYLSLKTRVTVSKETHPLYFFIFSNTLTTISSFSWPHDSLAQITSLACDSKCTARLQVFFFK